ncbi:MAG: sigma-54 dependent transcriptional regulator [Pseudomonadota bacterium]
MAGPIQLLVGVSPQIAKLRSWLDKVAASDASVLITGETGTGKEGVARYLHEHSPRAAKPMACINCSALPEGLIESELFGHERGSFTGAHQSARGRIREAAGGTLFLDEIGDMPHAAQAKILRALENHEVTPVGGRRGEPIDVRVIAATNVEPRTLLADNRLRRDLFYRLNVVELHLPPLRDRKEDIILLFDHFMRTRLPQGALAPKLTAAGVQRMIDHDWPGNVREVRNLVERLLIDLPAGEIPDENLPGASAGGSPDTHERERLLAALVTTRWNKRKAAAALQWSRMTLYRKLAKHNISGKHPKP